MSLLPDRAYGADPWVRRASKVGVRRAMQRRGGALVIAAATLSAEPDVCGAGCFVPFWNPTADATRRIASTLRECSSATVSRAYAGIRFIDG